MELSGAHRQTIGSYSLMRKLASVHTIDKIRKHCIIDLLITLFRTGIHSENMMIPVKEEIEHVKAYIGIQEIRFPDLFDTQILVSNEVLNERMLKLLLQPLVENAINHGIREGNQYGHIVIKADYTDQKITFTVSDNVIGIEKDKLEELNNLLKNNIAKSSVGIYNVNERLRLRYGDAYGLVLESTRGKGKKQ